MRDHNAAAFGADAACGGAVRASPATLLDGERDALKQRLEPGALLRGEAGDLIGERPGLPGLGDQGDAPLPRRQIGRLNDLDRAIREGMVGDRDEDDVDLGPWNRRSADRRIEQRRREERLGHIALARLEIVAVTQTANTA